MTEQEILQNSTFGAIHTEDSRDVQLSDFATAVPIPDAYQTDISAIPVEMQNQIGACVAHALSTSLKTLHYIQTGELIDLTPRFMYAETKAIDGIADQGTDPRTEMGVYKTKGCCTKALLPNDTTLSYADYINIAHITPQALTEASSDLLKVPETYAFANIDRDSICQAIFQYKVCSVLMEVGNTYWVAPDGTTTWDASKILPIQRPQVIEGGHEIMFYGYEQQGTLTKIFFRNSWSSAWADGGNGWFWLDEHLDLIKQVMVITEVPPQVLNQTKLGQCQLGETSDTVKACQTWLINHGYSIPAGATGFYGQQTQQAVEKLQFANGFYFNLGRNVGVNTLVIMMKN